VHYEIEFYLIEQYYCGKICLSTGILKKIIEICGEELLFLDNKKAVVNCRGEHHSPSMTKQGGRTQCAPTLSMLIYPDTDG
jgi:hypothetical protein